MKFVSTSRPGKCLEGTLLGVSFLAVLCYVIVALARAWHPFQLEWLEGGVLEHVRRILAGQRIYVEPSLDFVPFIYTPLYFYISAALTKIVGLGFAPLRLVSFSASVGVMAVIFLFVRRETERLLPAALAVGLFAAAFRVGGAWLDLARVDSLFLFFLLAAIYLLRFHVSPKKYLAAGALISLAFLTKQAALVAAIPLFFLGFYSDRRSFFYFAAAATVIIGASTLLLDLVHGGWYSYFILDLPRAHAVDRTEFARLWRDGVLLSLPLASASAIVYLAARVAGPDRKEGVIETLVAVSLIGGSSFASAHSGSYDNVLLPAIAGLSILFGTTAHWWLKTAQNMPAERRIAVEMGVCLLCLVQFGLLAYDPREQIPSLQSKDAGRALVERISRIEGEVLIPRHGYLAQMAGKQSLAHEMAMTDVLRGDETGGTALRTEILLAIQRQRFSAVIVDYDWIKLDLQRHYRRERDPVIESARALQPITGSKTRPKYLYVPRKKD